MSVWTSYISCALQPHVPSGCLIGIAGLPSLAPLGFCVLPSYYSSLLSLCSSHTGLRAVPQINQAFPVLGPLHLLFPLFGILFPREPRS